jgi:hypothetical protein
MTDLTLSAPVITRQAIEAKDRTARLRVTGKLKSALAYMVWECLKRPDAAAKAGMSDHGLREALRKPHVRAHYLSELQVLRTSERARNIHRLTEIRDKADNMPAVQAIKMLEEFDSETATRSTGSLSLPGLTIQIINTAAGADVNSSLTRSDAKPLIEHEDGSHDRDD